MHVAGIARGDRMAATEESPKPRREHSVAVPDQPCWWCGAAGRDPSIRTAVQSPKVGRLAGTPDATATAATGAPNSHRQYQSEREGWVEHAIFRAAGLSHFLALSYRPPARPRSRRIGRLIRRSAEAVRRLAR